MRIKNFKLKIINYNRGVSLYLAVLIMAILLAMALGLSTIFLGQIRVIRGMGYSVIAFYAADAGIEMILTQRTNPVPIPETLLSNGSAYQVIVTAAGTGNCQALNYCIKSLGTYKETSRAIEIIY